jgi:beta-glucosidase-like glycosyl hydrolase
VNPPSQERAAARLLLPAVRWEERSGFSDGWPAIEHAVRAGVGGFIIFGGEAAAVRDLTEEMRRISPHPLLIASDLERGAGQQFRGATPLPPAAALASLDDPEATRRAAEITAREARALGIGWVLAPVADVDLEPRNPIVGTRAFGADPVATSRQVEAGVGGCAAGGALSCAKHFPGHGRTTGDSHVERPRVDASRAELEQDQLPFRAAIAAGVDAVMAAHVAYPPLDPSGEAATRSAPILTGLLRRALRFDGIVATDAINMAGFGGEEGEGEGAVRALAAGCDVLLYPRDLDGTLAALAASIRTGRLETRRVGEAAARLERAARRSEGTAGGRWGREEDLAWALRTAIGTVHVLRGAPALPEGAVRVVEIDDDVGGPHPPPDRDALPEALRREGVQLTDAGLPLLAIYSDVRAWKGPPGLSPRALARVAEVLAAAPEAPVLLFGHPRFVAQIPDAKHVVGAWGGEAVMQQAAAGWLTRSRSTA